MSKRTTIIFFALVGYIVLQFLWWEVLIVRQSNELIEIQKNIIALESTNNKQLMEKIVVLDQQKMRRVYMTVGEGTVFLLILLGGAYQVLKSIKKERELSAQQSNFILSVSHELKTPIASSKLQLQTLLKHELEREKQIQLLNNAITESDRLQKLVDNILLVTQVENNSISAHFSNLNFSELIETTLERYFDMYIKNNWLCLTLEPNVELKGDKDLLPSLIINLIENAIKYSYETLEVRISLKQINHQVILEITDKGCGVNDSEKEKIFEKFYRSGNEEVRKTKGTGIGLYIVKQIANMHHAHITVKPNQPSGSIFTLQFPENKHA